MHSEDGPWHTLNRHIAPPAVAPPAPPAVAPPAPLAVAPPAPPAVAPPAPPAVAPPPVVARDNTILAIFSHPSASSSYHAHNVFGVRIGPGGGRTVSFRNRFGLDSTDAFYCHFGLVGGFWIPVSAPVSIGLTDYNAKYVHCVNNYPFVQPVQVGGGGGPMRPYSVLVIDLMNGNGGVRKILVDCIAMLCCSNMNVH